MTKNKKVMSMAIVPAFHEELKKLAKRKGTSASAYVGNLVEQALKLDDAADAVVVGKPPDEELLTVHYSKEEVVPVVLKIPAQLKNHPDKLRQWLDVQANGIHKHMTKHLAAGEPTQG